MRNSIEDASRSAAATGDEPPSLSIGSALFLDIDGTLLDLAPSPAMVEIDQAISALLPALHYHLGGAVALITGRTIVDAKQLFPSAGLLIAGQHGLERMSSSGRLHAHSDRPAGYNWLAAALHRLAERHEGVWLEDKGATLAVHYRQAPGLASYIHRAVRELIGKSGLAGADWRLQKGKSIVEIKPAGRDKGAAILDYMAEPLFAGRLPVFVGDDLTDEYGFSAVAVLGGISVKVGPGRTRARYRLRNVSAVRRWLAGLLRQPSLPGDIG